MSLLNITYVSLALYLYWDHFNMFYLFVLNRVIIPKKA